jgi:hypothetical protein
VTSLHGLYAFLLGLVAGGYVMDWHWRRDKQRWPADIKPQLAAEGPPPPRAPKVRGVCAHKTCPSRPDPRCGAGHCGEHCVWYCPPRCREGEDAAARAKVLLSRFGPLETEKTE